MLFTFLAEYKGGTFIEQISARSVRGAVAQWRRRILKNDVAALPGLADEDDVEAYTTPIEGAVHCWCYCCRDSRGKFLLVNIVRTVPATS